MKLPTVSVVMATFNHANFVTQAIESVLEQKGVDFEFLIADDGSTDQTRAAVALSNDKRIRFFPHEENRGACIVTNELIGCASGEFIALINSDDYWSTPEKLSYQVEVMRGNPGIGACFGRARFVDKSGREIDKALLPSGTIFDQENRSQGQWLRHFFDLGNCICHPTILIRRSCYDEIGMYNNRFRQLPDFDLWIRLVKSYGIFISDRDLINFRILPGENVSSWTINNSIRTINEQLLIAENFFDGVSRDQLIEGFSDLLVFKDIPTEEHLHVEKARLFFIKNRRVGKPYKIIGLLKMYQLLSDSKYRDLLIRSYRMDDRWFQQQTGEIDVLQPRIMAELKGKKRSIKAGINRIAGLFSRNRRP